jgi:hypothetical protein
MCAAMNSRNDRKENQQHSSSATEEIVNASESDEGEEQQPSSTHQYDDSSLQLLSASQSAIEVGVAGMEQIYPILIVSCRVRLD